MTLQTKHNTLKQQNNCKHYFEHPFINVADNFLFFVGGDVFSLSFPFSFHLPLSNGITEQSGAVSGRHFQSPSVFFGVSGTCFLGPRFDEFPFIFSRTAIVSIVLKYNSNNNNNNNKKKKKKYNNRKYNDDDLSHMHSRPQPYVSYCIQHIVENS